LRGNPWLARAESRDKLHDHVQKAQIADRLLLTATGKSS
jgi:hypothetical protein